MPSYSIPIQIMVVESFPKTRIGKIDYRALEKQAEEISKKRIIRIAPAP